MVALMLTSKYNYEFFRPQFQPIIDSIILYIENINYDMQAPESLNISTMSELESEEDENFAVQFITNNGKKFISGWQEYDWRCNNPNLFYATQLQTNENDYVNLMFHTRKKVKPKPIDIKSDMPEIEDEDCFLLQEPCCIS